ncbi:MAG: hypothetical protein HOC77_06695 [Chloroflexi bacterium]|jgi:signal transduction histidine kinase|nr:hypothetical protein [Chloroflexota bacterium]MBT4073391.1 hypothetical protein [Chloroflexota bacterium]MBT4514764.1 hypothetical protein [Chloroflexota bacterium]MBT5320508.1 hypothetical protein [Chloroflexota bacterium]MBT6681070.1 hypothetical protein [Chloroflexota bacterium]
MTRRNWVILPGVLGAALSIGIVALSGDSTTPAGLLLLPIVALTTSFLAVPLALAFAIAAGTALGITYWTEFGIDGVPRTVIESSLVLSAAFVSIYVTSRFHERASERRLLERIRAASSSSALLDRVYEDIYEALKAYLPVDRFAIVVERPGDDELEVAFASGVFVPDRVTGDTAPLVVDEDGWKSVSDGRVHLLTGGGVRPESNTSFLGAGLKSGLRVQLGSRNNPTGYIELRSRTSNAFTEHDTDLIALVASEVSLTIGGARYRSQVIRVGEERVSRMRVAAEKQALEDTQRKLASMNEQLEAQNEIIRRSRERLLNADEAARQSIAEELHGPVQTKLLMIWHALSMIRSNMDAENFDTETLATSLDDALDQLDRIREDDIRLLSHRLHPSIVRVSALAGLRSLQEFYESTIPVELDVGEEVEALEPAGDSRIPESVRLAVHRVADAALANVVKHAGATEAVIHWHYDREGQLLELSVTDDGRGFEPDARAPSGLGLLTIRDYVDAIGGNLSVTSFPGEGTGVDVVIPFVDEEARMFNVPEDPGAIGSVLNMHWTPPLHEVGTSGDNEDEDGPDFPHAIGQ